MDDRARVEEAARKVVASHDPTAVPTEEFLGACFDAGLSWVHFPEGLGGLGVSRGLQSQPLLVGGACASSRPVRLGASLGANCALRPRITRR